MPVNESASSDEAIHRKLRAIAAVLLDPAATEHERANAEALKLRLERQLRQEATPGIWTDIMFRLGRAVKDIKQPIFFVLCKGRLDGSCLPIWQNTS
jgi:hypothetical protein